MNHADFFWLAQLISHAIRRSGVVIGSTALAMKLPIFKQFVKGDDLDIACHVDKLPNVLDTLLVAFGPTFGREIWLEAIPTLTRYNRNITLTFNLVTCPIEADAPGESISIDVLVYASFDDYNDVRQAYLLRRATNVEEAAEMRASGDELGSYRALGIPIDSDVDNRVSGRFVDLVWGHYENWLRFLQTTVTSEDLSEESE